MSDNPFGLSEINHYGSMQRVGGKAAGFINKKFFHPSSLANQEKLWKALTKQDELDREQRDADSRREEERQVEASKKQMYQRGQAPAGSGDFFIISSAAIDDGDSELGGKQKREQRLAFEEQKRRKGILKEERWRAAEEDADAAETGAVGVDAETEGADGQLAASSSSSSSSSSSFAAAGAGAAPVQLAKSSYPEDVHKCGHDSVLGSWFSTEMKRWGYRCCETTESKKRCPHGPEEVAPPVKDRAPRGDRGAKRRRGAGGQGGRPKHAEDRAKLVEDQRDACAAVGDNAEGDDEEAAMARALDEFKSAGAAGASPAAGVAGSDDAQATAAVGAVAPGPTRFVI